MENIMREQKRQIKFIIISLEKLNRVKQHAAIVKNDKTSIQIDGF